MTPILSLMGLAGRLLMYVRTLFYSSSYLCTSISASCVRTRFWVDLYYFFRATEEMMTDDVCHCALFSKCISEGGIEAHCCMKSLAARMGQQSPRVEK